MDMFDCIDGGEGEFPPKDEGEPRPQLVDAWSHTNPGEQHM
jgi:hypothetical protein